MTCLFIAAWNSRRFHQQEEIGRLSEILQLQLEGGNVFSEGLRRPNEGEPEGHLLHHWRE